MSYLVLARKYRPRSFAQVVGQEVAVRTLQGALQDDRVGHAYLFCGPRGTGKTTLARILAKALDCEHGPAAEPCLECERCRAIEGGTDIDVIEIDAASNRGIDDVRELRERVAYAPMRARFKVYIVDEVHMLTKEANNALLKTLEEPPAHVKFLFATTEPQKLLDTVRSRCQVVQLGLIREELIAAALCEVLAREGVTPGPGVVEELARRARGSLRDALSQSDQLLALVGAAPGLEDLRRIGGTAGLDLLDALLSRIEEGDRAGVIAALAPVAGGELELVSGLLEHVRGCLLSALVPRESELFESEPAERARRAARAARLPVERLQAWLEELLCARERMQAMESHARIVLEVTLLDLCRPETSLSLSDLERRLLELEGRLGAGTASAGPARTALAPPREAGPPARAPSPSAPAPAPAPSAPRTRAANAASPPREAAAPADPDTFTASVADLFGGRVEEA